MEPPSSRLIQTLRQLQLCTAADLRKCRSRVRRLARDIPAFDSVWIDALQQLGRLTPFQASAIESDEPQRLRIGPCLLRERLGGGRISQTFLASLPTSGETRIVKVVELPEELRPSRQSAMELTTSRLRGWNHPHVVGPSQVLVHEGKLVILSSPVKGPHLGELLVRRGRMPAPVIEALATQLIDALAALESRSVVHGDVCLRNIRLTPEGRAVLTESGVLTALQPELTIHAGLSPDRYEGTAPERIGTGRPPDSRSDIYALGCMLWQLLAGRPPHPTADPLGKLAAHQTRPIADVRTWAPETPARLAEAIAAFTRQDPGRRPPNFRWLRERWGVPTGRHRRTIRRFVAQFSTPAGALSHSARKTLVGFWPATAAFLLLLSGVAASLSDARARNVLLSIRSEASDWIAANWSQRGHQQSHDTSEDAVALVPMPLPDARGTIQLRGGVSYEATNLAAASAIALRGEPGRLAEIVIEEESLALSAERVILEHMVIRVRSKSTDNPAVSLLKVRANQLLIRDCHFVSEFVSDSPIRTSVDWSPLDRNSRLATQVQFHDATFRLPGPVFQVETPPKALRVRNVLCLGKGPLAHQTSPNTQSSRWNLDLARLTLRGTECLLRTPLALNPSTARIEISAKDCVFDLRGSEGALVEFMGRPTSSDSLGTISLLGEGSLIRPDCPIAGFRDSDNRKLVPIPDSNLEVEGLTSGGFQFAGPSEGGSANSVLKSWNAPRQSPTPPGIDAVRFSTHAAPSRHNSTMTQTAIESPL